MNHHPQPDQIAMLFKGTERYGIGTIVKIYALHAPGMHMVAFRDGYLTRWLQDRGVPVIRVDGPAHLSFSPGLGATALPRTMVRMRRSAERLSRILTGRGIRILHSHWYAQQWTAGFLRRHGYRSVWQINNYINRGGLYHLRRGVHHRIARWGADMLLPASDFVGLDWSGCGVPQRTIHNAAMPDVSPRQPPAPPLRCVAVGRLDPTKGIHVAVDAIARARDAGADVRLDIYGGPLKDNPYADALQRQIDATPHGQAIRLCGFRDDLRRLHGDYHFGIQCRLDPEPCSLWVCEALHDGLPLLASATGGTPELVEEGSTGFLYPPGNVKALSDAVLRVAASPEILERMRRKGLREARSYFSTERFVRQTFDAYHQILETSSGRVPPHDVDPNAKQEHNP